MAVIVFSLDIARASLFAIQAEKSKQAHPKQPAATGDVCASPAFSIPPIFLVLLVPTRHPSTPPRTGVGTQLIRAADQWRSAPRLRFHAARGNEITDFFRNALKPICTSPVRVCFVAMGACSTTMQAYIAEMSICIALMRTHIAVMSIHISLMQVHIAMM
jgi:hypothetical protein